MIKINNKRMQKVIESRINESATTIFRLVKLLEKKLILLGDKERKDIIEIEVEHQHKDIIKNFAVYKNKIKKEFISNQVFKLLGE